MCERKARKERERDHIETRQRPDDGSTEMLCVLLHTRLTRLRRRAVRDDCVSTHSITKKITTQNISELNVDTSESLK